MMIVRIRKFDFIAFSFLLIRSYKKIFYRISLVNQVK